MLARHFGTATNYSTYLVEIGLQVVLLLRVLEQPRPELFLQILLLQLHLDRSRAVVDLALLGVDLVVELHLDLVICLFTC